MAANRDGVEVGDIFVMSWGYDQTNVEAWQVLRTTVASVELMKIGMELTADNRVRPDAGRYIAGEKLMKRTIPAYSNGSVSVNMASYAGCYLWDGVRSFYDTYAAGGAGH